MELFAYLETEKYKNYTRNKEIFDEKSAGVFRTTVNSRIKLELMGSGALVSGSTVFSGYDGKQASSFNIGDLVVPSNILSAITSTYISYAVNGRVVFGESESEYMLQKVKTLIKEQSIGGSALMKVVEDNGQPYINIYNAISYFTIEDEFIQDKKKAYVIFNVIEENGEDVTYMLETHEGATVTYSVLKQTVSEENNEREVKREFVDCIIEGMQQKDGENGAIVSYEELSKPAVAEVVNLVFSGLSDYTDDNIALLRELVVLNTINSQTFDKIANPLLALPEEALEYDEAGNAKVSLQDRVIIIRDGGNKPEQISLESRIEQTDQHRENLANQIFSSLAVNTIALGTGGDGALSGIAIERMLENTSSRVIEKRTNVSKAFKELLDIDIEFSDPIGDNYKEEVQTAKTAVDGGFMSIKKACIEIGNEDDYTQIQKENKEALGLYEGFDDTKGE